MNYPYASFNLEADRAKKTVVKIFQTESQGPLDGLSVPDAESVSVTNEQKETSQRSNSSLTPTDLRDIKHLLPSSYCSEVNRLLRELAFLSWFAQQKKERRRLVIASLESLLPASDGRPGSPIKQAKLRESKTENESEKTRRF
jgi:hypothetical protein